MLTGQMHSSSLASTIRPAFPQSLVFDLLPRLCDDGCWFEQHAQEAERIVNFHRVLRLNSPTLRHEPINLLDAAFSVLAVAAHVPFTHSAVWARNWIGTPNDADDQIALLESGRWISFQDAAEGLMTKYETCLVRRRPSVFPFDNFDVSTADSNCDGFYEYRALTNIWLRDLFPLGTP